MTNRTIGFDGTNPVKAGDIKKLVRTKELYKWIVERHEIYRRRLAGAPVSMDRRLYFKSLQIH